MISATGESKRTESLAADRAELDTSLWRRIRRDALVLGAGNIAIVIAQLGFRGILVASLAPSAYGRLSLVLSIYNTVWIIGASGLPNSVARYIALNDGEDDTAIIHSALVAGALPTSIAIVVTATASGIILKSVLAGVLAAMGIVGLVYSLLTMGILRGRGRMASSASIMPIGAIGELAPLAILVLTGVGVTTLSAFTVFCLGNLIGLGSGLFFTIRTSPRRFKRMSARHSAVVPGPRELLGFSLWLATATVGMAVLPVVVRFAATLDSYTLVAIVDVALVLFTIPQRIGTVIVFAVIPHATRALGTVGVNLRVTRREHAKIVLPFLLAAAIVAFTPLVGWLADALGRPVYGQSADYLALALLAGPARILYGVVEGVLVAQGEGRFLALTALSIAAVAAVMIVAATVLGGASAAFAVFAAAIWAIYLVGLQRMNRLALSVKDVSVGSRTVGAER